MILQSWSPLPAQKTRNQKRHAEESKKANKACLHANPHSARGGPVASKLFSTTGRSRKPDSTTRLQLSPRDRRRGSHVEHAPTH